LNGQSAGQRLGREVAHLDQNLAYAPLGFQHLPPAGFVQLR